MRNSLFSTNATVQNVELALRIEMDIFDVNHHFIYQFLIISNFKCTFGSLFHMIYPLHEPHPKEGALKATPHFLLRKQLLRDQEQRKRMQYPIYASLTLASKTLTASGPLLAAVVGLGIARPPFSCCESSKSTSRLVLTPFLPLRSNGVAGLLAMNCNDVRYVGIK